MQIYTWKMRSLSLLMILAVGLLIAGCLPPKQDDPTEEQGDGGDAGLDSGGLDSGADADSGEGDGDADGEEVGGDADGEEGDAEVGDDADIDEPGPSRQIQSIRPTGVRTLAGGDCRGIIDQGTLKMVLMGDDRLPIKQGDELEAGVFELSSDRISFENGRVFSFPDQSCVGGTCQNGMQCGAPPTGLEHLGDRCSGSAGLGLVGEPRFVGAEPEKQALAIVMSNEGRWRGWLSHDVGGLFPVRADGTPLPNSQRDLGPNPGRAADNTTMRYGGARQFSQDLMELSNYVAGQDREVLYGFWTFSESIAATDSWVGKLAGDYVPWTRRHELMNQAIDTAADLPAAQNDRANIYYNAINILEEAFQAPPAAGEAGHDPDHWYWSLLDGVEKKKMILIVGGPDEYRQSANSVEALIGLAQQTGTEIHVVHADPPMDVSLLRDDPKYYEEQSVGCASDSECKNFEECRIPQFFCDADRADACTSVAFPADTNKKVCLPARDDNGRTGPIQDYQRLACETGGSYSYLPVMTAHLLYNRISGIPYEEEAGWEIDFAIDQADSLEGGEPYSLAGELEIEFGRRATYQFSQFGRVGGDVGVPSSWDTRLIFFRR